MSSTYNLVYNLPMLNLTIATLFLAFLSFKLPLDLNLNLEMRFWNDLENEICYLVFLSRCSHFEPDDGLN